MTRAGRLALAFWACVWALGAPAWAADAPESPTAPPLGHVSYHEEEAFVLAVPRGPKDALVRAKEASRALAVALDSAEPAQPQAPLAQVVVEGEAATIRVRGYPVAVVFADDAQAAGHPSLDTYAAALETNLGAYVPAQLKRGSLQSTVLHVFLSFFLAVLAVVVLRQLRAAFDRAEEALEQRKGALPALTVLRMPVMGPEAVAGVLAFLLDVGRVAAYVATALGTVAGVLGQFPTTRPWLNLAGSAAGKQLVQTTGGLVQTLPGMVLALLLALAVHGALRVLDVLVEGVRQGRVTWRGLAPERAGLFRAWVHTGALLLAAPLVVGAAFGRFGTPWETLTLWTAGAVLLGAVPLWARWLVGGAFLWRAAWRPGDWVNVGGLVGEITHVDHTELCLVPAEGGTLHIPTLRLLWTPVQRLGPPHQEVAVWLEAGGPVGALLGVVQTALAPLGENLHVELASVEAARVLVRLHIPGRNPQARHHAWTLLAQAAERGELRLGPTAVVPSPQAAET